MERPAINNADYNLPRPTKTPRNLVSRLDSLMTRLRLPPGLMVAGLAISDVFTLSSLPKFRKTLLAVTRPRTKERRIGADSSLAMSKPTG
jgi:hypothetical protein